jgi:hypothetical protein
MEGGDARSGLLLRAFDRCDVWYTSSHNIKRLSVTS